MDNELDKRLQRLEAGQADQAEKLSRLLNGQERIHQTLMGLSAQMAEDENGLKLYEVLANLARAVDRNSAEMRMLVRRSSRQPDPSH